MPKETNSTEKNTQASNDNKVTVKKTIKIKWNALDGLLSVVFLVVLLVGIYFGTAALLKYLDAEKFINLNISSIDNLTFSIFYGIQVLLMLGVVWFFAIYWRRSSFKDLGFKYYSILKTVWYSFLALVLIFVFSFLYVLALKYLLGIEAPPSKIEDLVANDNVSGNILIIVTAVVAPFCEEIYFRGFLYSAFKKSFGIIPGLFISSLLFSLAHLELYSFIPIMVIGWILAYIYEKTKSIFTVIFLHSVYNLILISILLGRIELIKMY